MQDGVEYLDTVLNVEFILFKMHSMFYWVSLAEISIFAFGILAWLKIIDQMGAVILFFPHLLRGIVGLLINRKFPRSHHVIDDIELLSDDSAKNRLTIDNLRIQLTVQFSSQFIRVYEENKKYLNGYLFLTYLSWGFNFLVFILMIKNYGTPGEEDAEMILFLVWLFYVGASLKWITFAYQVKKSLPEKIGNMFYEGALKFGDDHLATAKSFLNDGIRGASNLRELNAYANQRLSNYNGGVASGNRI